MGSNACHASPMQRQRTSSQMLCPPRFKERKKPNNSEKDPTTSLNLRDKTQGGSSQIGWWEPETDAKHLAFISQSQSNGTPLTLEAGEPWGSIAGTKPVCFANQVGIKSVQILEAPHPHPNRGWERWRERESAPRVSLAMPGLVSLMLGLKSRRERAVETGMVLDPCGHLLPV